MPEFKKIFKKIDKAINASKTQALNKAANSTKTLYAKEVSAELGLPSARVKKRARIKKASNADLSVELSIGTRVKFAAHDFKLSKKKVNTAKGARYTPSIKVKGNKTQLSDKAFLVEANNTSTTKKLVLERVGDSRYPTKTVLVDVFEPTVEEIKPDLEEKMRDEFEKNFKSQLKYNLNK